MPSYLIDSTYLIDLIHREPSALIKAQEFLDARRTVFIPTVVIYEVGAGIAFSRNRREETAFAYYSEEFPLLPLDEGSAMEAARFQGEFRRQGREKAHCDIMIAGIAKHSHLTLITRDQDFMEISEQMGFRVETY